MALHRDIFWVGKQWAVTGYGMQAVDQKQKSKFDIEASRLWEEDLQENLSDQRWFNAEDFNAGLLVARAKYPQEPGKAAARKKAVVKESAPAPVAPSKPASEAEPRIAPKAKPKAELPKSEAASAASKLSFAGSLPKSTLKIDAKVRPRKRPPAQFNIQIERWPAKFTRMWRVRINRQ